MNYSQKMVPTEFCHNIGDALSDLFHEDGDDKQGQSDADGSQDFMRLQISLLGPEQEALSGGRSKIICNMSRNGGTISNYVEVQPDPIGDLKLIELIEPISAPEAARFQSHSFDETLLEMAEICNLDQGLAPTSPDPVGKQVNDGGSNNALRFRGPSAENSLDYENRQACCDDKNSTDPIISYSQAITDGSTAIYDKDLPLIIHQSTSTTIYRAGSVGIKVLTNQLTTNTNTKHLMNEQSISNFLPPLCPTRKVLEVKGFRGLPAFRFKWENGVTLEEWVRNAEGHGQINFSIRLRVAVAVTKSLSDFHDGGAAHNKLTAENIILGIRGEGYVATLIDLSQASIFLIGKMASNNTDSVQVQAKRSDLESLGRLLLRIFTGEDHPVKDEEKGDIAEVKDVGYKRRRGNQHSSVLGLPMYLSSLISTLLRLGDGVLTSEGKYESSRDVFLDLRTMAEKPQYFMQTMDSDISVFEGHLQVPKNSFHGRKIQISLLMHSFHSVVSLGGRCMMALVTGYPGTGKSSLVRQIKQPLKEHDGYFIEKKIARPYDQDQHTSTLLSALNDFFGELLMTSEENEKLFLRWRINDAIGSGSNVLIDLIPNLQDFLGDESISEQHRVVFGLMGASNRIKFLICKLIGAIASASNPVILFIDDLQWVDEDTLDVIKMILTDPEINYVLFLGCYRDGEVTDGHLLTAKIRDIQEHGVSVTSIKLGPIEKEHVNSLVSETLCLPLHLCCPLSTVIHRKTGGIILFVIHFLKSLNEEGLLWFSLGSRRWEFDIHRIRSKNISEDVVQFMAQKMKMLPEDLQMNLKLSACLGAQFEASTLKTIGKGDEHNIDTLLHSAVENGFLVKSSPIMYMWAHDQVQQAAYELIPLEKRESFHLLLGSKIFMKTASEDLDKVLFLAADNMNRGLRLLALPDQRYEVARLNLQAGEKAIASSSFLTAVSYLKKGISLLNEDSWTEEYDLSLNLYDAAGEALFATGNFSELRTFIEAPLLFAQCFGDKLNTYNNLVRSFSGSGMLLRGIAKCVDVLSRLGVEFPIDVTTEFYREEAKATQKLLDGKSESELMNLPVMTDRRKLAAMQFMNHAFLMAWIASSKLSPVIVFRMIQISIAHGACNVSAFAFACYGAWLVNTNNSDYEGGYRVGKVAMSLLSRFAAKEFVSRVHASVFGMINIWKEPFQASLERHLEAYETGIRTGDTEYANINLLLYSASATFCCGVNLTRLEKDVCTYIKRAIHCNQEIILKFYLPLHQLILDLIGSELQSYSLFKPGMTDESYLNDARGSSPICRFYWMLRKHKAFLFGNMDGALQFYERCLEYPIGPHIRMVGVMYSTFIDGLIAFYFARKGGKDQSKWEEIGEGIIKTMKHWVKSSAWNFRNKLLLIEAEYFFFKGDSNKAMECYQASAKAAIDSRFVHEEGMAYEKAATFLLHNGKHSEALGYFSLSKECYENWGSQALVDRIEKVILMLRPLC